MHRQAAVGLGPGCRRAETAARRRQGPHRHPDGHRSGLWDPVSIVSACTRARGLQVFEVDRSTAKPKNEGRLDEIKIARICGADGLRPYLSRKSNLIQRNAENFAPPNLGVMVARGVPGGQTWSFQQVLWSERNDDARANSYAWRKAVRTLQDVGLLDVTPGPRSGLVRAVCRWTPLAYLPEIAPAPMEIHPDDDHALDCLAHGAPNY
jgi:hypothetical protein